MEGLIMTSRQDLLAEIDITLDGSGNYVGDWLDSSGVLTVRIVIQTMGSTNPADVSLEQSSDQTNEVSTDGFSEAFGEFEITARYFRLLVTGGQASVGFRAVIRDVTKRVS
jgi:hypothetical protein